MKSEVHYLSPILAPQAQFDEIELRIKLELKKKIYLPLVTLLGRKPTVLYNSAETDQAALWSSLNSGRVTYNHGIFSGSFDAATSRALKSLGAKWDRKADAFRLQLSEMSSEVQHTVRATESRFHAKISEIDARLAQLLPENIAEGLNLSSTLDKTLWKVEKEFRTNVKNISFVPELTDSQARKISDEWQDNLRLYVKDFAAEEIGKLRQQVKTATFAGNRYGSLLKTIQSSYGVSANKAKFLARQETRLLTTKYQESRYVEAGVPEYKWDCVAGTPAHPVRPWHLALKGTTQRWDRPPVTTKPGDPQRRNNPGGDYNCRCFAIPIVRFAA